jgi:hypothetical protein
MEYRPHNHQLFFNFALAILILTGCAPQIQRPMRVCPRAESAADLLSLLSSRSQNAVSFKANGQCCLQYYDQGKPHKESFPVKLWVNPLAEVYLQGDIAFDAKGLVLGSNEREFWLSIRPKEINTYWWGQWPEAAGIEGLVISPKVVLEALGLGVGGEEDNNWYLSSKNGFDILTSRKDGVVMKKIYIDRRNCQVKRVEYFGDSSEALLVTELSKYEEVSDGFSVPTIIEMVRHSKDGKEDSVRIDLKSLKSAGLSEKLRNLIFTRPKPQGFKHVYKIIDGNMIEQSQ